MEKRKDAPAGEGTRYVEVAPAGSQVALSPYTYYDRTPAKATIGEYSRVVLRVDDVRATCRELSGKGVRFDGQPFESDGGVFATMRDPWANLFILAERHQGPGSTKTARLSEALGRATGCPARIASLRRTIDAICAHLERGTFADGPVFVRTCMRGN